MVNLLGEMEDYLFRGFFAVVLSLFPAAARSVDGSSLALEIPSAGWLLGLAR